jgi:hypothetical protein
MVGIFYPACELLPSGRSNYTCVLLPVVSCVVEHNLQEFYTLFLVRFRTYRITSQPQTKITSQDDI